MRMCSGAAWSEVDDGRSDDGRLRRALASRRRGSILDLLCTLPRAQPQGVVFNYSTGESCLLVAAATGLPLADYGAETGVSHPADFRHAGAQAECSNMRQGKFDRQRQPAIWFRRREDGRSSFSKLGGRPTLPPDIECPRHGQAGA